MKVGLFVTCLVDQLFPHVGRATVEVLRRAGCTVEFPRAQTCCGQPAWNSGFAREARSVARTLLDAFEGCQHVVAPSGSCVGMLRHGYGPLFAGEPRELERARNLASRTHELAQFLVGVLGVEDLGARFAGRATYHPSCHGLRIAGVRDEPERLLARVGGLELVPLPRAEDCCGFGGAFCVKLPAISAAMVGEKVDHVLESGAPVVIGTDMGCLANIEGHARKRGLDLRAVHLAEVLASG
jgi:L-lactate dehydrogenase complex protein LldE